MTRYIDIGGGYSYAPLRVGLALRSPEGLEVYVQPGDDEAVILRTIEALGEIEPLNRSILTDMALGGYFQ